jgi:hypothetical protein
MEKKVITTLLGGVIIVLAIIAGIRFFSGPEDTWLCVNNQWVKHGQPSAAMPTSGCGNALEIKDFNSCAAAGNPVMESYPRQCSANGQTFVEEITGNDKINIISPKPNETIASPLKIAGEAKGSWYFEASFPIKLEDEAGNIIAQTTAAAQSDWMTENMVPFFADLTFNSGTTTKGFLVFANDNPSGLPENDESIKIPVLFKAEEQTTIKIFFGKYGPDSTMQACEKVYPVERTVAKTEAIGRVAIEQLLAGLTSAEQTEYYTSINPGVKINSLTIDNGIAKVDFDKQIEYQLGGSCRVSAIRAQITETLKQFPTVKEVIISVDGRVDDALQP